MFYCDITDHLPCFVSLKCNLCVDNANRSKARLFGDKKCRKFKELMKSYDWITLYLSSPDLYRSFISVVKRFYEISFSMVTLSRSRMRGKPWVTKGLKISIKNNHTLYKLYIRSGDPKVNITDIRTCFEFVLGRLKTNIIRIYVKSLVDDGNYVISLFVNLTKAFDIVDHEILLYKLDRYGIRGHANALFQSYLTDRKQFTIDNGVEYELKDIGCGVSQGSVLGLLFFALYINDLYKAIGEDYIRLFADYTALFSWH